MKKFAVALSLLVLASAAQAQIVRINPTPEQDAAGRRVATRELRDPDSAQFRDVRFFGDRTGDGQFVMCAEVNAKNAYGGYVGYRHVVAFSSGEAIFGEVAEVNCRQLR